MEPADSLIMNWRSALLGCVIVCTVLVLLNLLVRSPERKATAYFGAFILAGMISSVPMVIGFAGAYDIWPGLTFLPTQFTLFYGPLIYLHARALMLGGSPRRSLWLLLPGVVYWLYQLWAFTLLGDYRSKWAFNDAVHEPYIVPLVMAIGFGLAIWALVMVWRINTQYRDWLDRNRADGEQFRPVWLTHFVWLGVPLVLIWALENVSGQYFGFDYFDRYWADFALLLLLFVITLEALARIQQPFPKMVQTETETEIAPSEDTTRDWSEDGSRLESAVIKNAWHLEKGVSLSELARRMGTNQAYLSKALNQGLGQSFSDFINRLRIEHAKTLISEQQLSMLDIALEAGFGSKASFNRAFKKYAGLTPSEFAGQQATHENA